MMRKFILMTVLMLANTAFANEQPKSLGLQSTANALESSSTAPIVALSVVDVMGDILRSLNTTEISRSQSTHQLCWEVVGLPIRDKYAVEEWIKSPVKARFVDSGGYTYTINHGQSHIITNKLRGMAGKVIKCWQFSENDPIGNYDITIKIDDLSFETLHFSVKP